MYCDCAATFINTLFEHFQNDSSAPSWGIELTECFGGSNTLLGPKALYFKIKKTKRKYNQNKFWKLEGVGALNKLVDRPWNPIQSAGRTWLGSIILIQIHGSINQQCLKCPRARVSVTDTQGNRRRHECSFVRQGSRNPVYLLLNHSERGRKRKIYKHMLPFWCV